MNQILRNKKDTKKVTINATVISNMFFNTESFEIISKKIPRKTIHINIIRKDIKNVPIPAFTVKKNGTEGAKPPKRGAAPFVIATIIIYSRFLSFY